MTPTEQAVDRVKALVEELRGFSDAHQWGSIRIDMDDIRTLLSALTALQARVGELEGALKPFAAEADTWSDSALENARGVYIAQNSNGSTFETTFSLADIARARASLTPPLEQDL